MAIFHNCATPRPNDASSHLACSSPFLVLHHSFFFPFPSITTHGIHLFRSSACRSEQSPASHACSSHSLLPLSHVSSRTFLLPSLLLPSLHHPVIQRRQPSSGLSQHHHRRSTQQEPPFTSRSLFSCEHDRSTCPPKQRSISGIPSPANGEAIFTAATLHQTGAHTPSDTTSTAPSLPLKR